MNSRYLWHGLGLCADPAGVTQIEPRSELTDPFVLASSRDQPDDVDEYTHASNDEAMALAFSVLSMGDRTCLVDPGELTPQADPDFPSLSHRFRGPLRVVKQNVYTRSQLPHARRIVQLLAPDTLSVPGQRWHHPDGRLQPPPTWREWGYTENDFDWLGPWYPADAVWQNPRNQLVSAVTSKGQFLIWPATRPLPSGVDRYKPTGTLAASWTHPGVVPRRDEFRSLIAGRQPVPPWQW